MNAEPLTTASASSRVEPVTVRLASADDRARWNGYVDQDPDASVYHRWEWGEIFQSVYGTRFFPFVAERGHRVVGVLPLVCLDRGPLGVELVSLPWFGHGGAIAHGDEPAWLALVREAGDLARRLGAKHVELRHAHAVPASHGLGVRDGKVLMHLALPASLEALDKRVGSKLRADVRRPQKEGIHTEVGGRELIGHFHDAYASVMRDLGSPCHAPALFDEAIARFPDRAFVVRAVYQGRTVGAAFLVGHGRVLEVPCAGTMHALNKLRPNMLLYWTCFAQAIERGYDVFSFGRSTVDAGTYAFKKNWGAEPVALPYHYALPDGAEVPGGHGESHALVTASKWWSKMPLAVTNALGPRIVRHLA